MMREDVFLLSYLEKPAKWLKNKKHKTNKLDRNDVRKRSKKQDKKQMNLFRV